MCKQLAFRKKGCLRRIGQIKGTDAVRVMEFIVLADRLCINNFQRNDFK